MGKRKRTTTSTPSTAPSEATPHESTVAGVIIEACKT